MNTMVKPLVRNGRDAAIIARLMSRMCVSSTIRCARVMARGDRSACMPFVDANPAA